MKQAFFDALTRYIEIVWRRRMLILVPMLAGLPLGFIAAQVIPQSYVAHALLALQETANGNPLAPQPEPGAEQALKDRAPGLEALVKSDRVITGALADVLGDKMPTDPRAIAIAVADIDKRLTLEMIGNSFVQISLTGNDQVGLGRQLEAITSRFLETLVSPDKDALSANQLVLARHRDALDVAEKALLRYKAQIGERAMAAIAADASQLADQQAQLKSQASDLDALDAEIANLRRAIGPAAAAGQPGQRDAEIRTANGIADAANQKRGGVPAADAQSARMRAEQLGNLQRMEVRSAAAHADLERAKAEFARRTATAGDERSPAGHLRRLEQDLSDARATVDAYAQRFPTAMPDRTLQVLNAPERIRVIDPPKDPAFPTLSRAKLIFAFALLGVFAAIGLTALAELLDQRLRHPEDFEDAAGVPVIARMPRVRQPIGRPRTGAIGDGTGPTPAPA